MSVGGDDLGAPSWRSQFMSVGGDDLGAPYRAASPQFIETGMLGIAVS